MESVQGTQTDKEVAMIIIATDEGLVVTEEDELEEQFDNSAMVSCTPCLDMNPQLPTLEVPYSDYMLWEWDIKVPCTVNMVIVIAKTRHRFKLVARDLRKGDTLGFDLNVEDIDHGH